MEKELERPSPERDDYHVNFFRPRPGFMRQKVLYTWFLLVGWAVFTFGFQFILMLTQRNASGEGPLTQHVVFCFPLHFWFSGQFLIVWFILLCFLFNIIVDQLTRIYRKRR